MAAKPLHCPICQREFLAESSASLPFCSARCKMVDLGRWLDEDYGLPVEREEGDDDNPSGHYDQED